MVDTVPKEIFALTKKIGKVSFPDVLTSLCNYKIIPFDKTIAEDAELLKHLTYALNNFVKLTKKTSSRYRGDRINDVGKQIEPLRRNLTLGYLQSSISPQCKYISP